ncbi:hypothetical protein C8F01DRAFT_1373036 [Mycena amicta]|nr:hypothetical protein C8F01DRAFT_1373036 [Mycena amicta]
MDEDAVMEPIDQPVPGGLPIPNRPRVSPDKGVPSKRVAVSSETHNRLDAALDDRAFFRAKMVETKRTKTTENERLRQELANAQRDAADALQQVLLFQDSLAKAQAQMKTMEAHEHELQEQFLADQKNLGVLLGHLTAAQKQLEESSGQVYRLQSRVHEREDENVHLRAQLQASARKAASAPNKRKGRLAELLKNTGNRTIELPIDPAPIPEGSPVAAPASGAAANGDSRDPQSMDVNKLAELMKQLMSGSDAKVTISRRKPPKAIRKAELKPEHRVVSNYALELMRKTTYKIFEVEQQSDFAFHSSASEQDVADFSKGQKAMPETLAQWDFNAGYQKSEWNVEQKKRIIEAAIKKDQEDNGFFSQGLIQRGFLEIVLSEQLDRIRLDWNKFQTKPKLDGTLESKNEAFARGKAAIEKRQEDARVVNQQHQKYKQRTNTVDFTISLKQAEGTSKDLASWERMKKVLEYLGPAGMSEEEDGFRLENGRKLRVYWIKLCVWREPTVTDFMRMIDNQTERLQDVQAGPKPALRERSKDEGKRAPPTRLPRCLYDAKWLASKTAAYQEKLEVSEEAFALFVAATERMVG